MHHATVPENVGSIVWLNVVKILTMKEESGKITNWNFPLPSNMTKDFI